MRSKEKRLLYKVQQYFKRGMEKLYPAGKVRAWDGGGMGDGQLTDLVQTFCMGWLSHAFHTGENPEAYRLFVGETTTENLNLEDWKWW